MSPADGLGAWFGQTEVLDLTCCYQISDRSGDILDRNVGVDAVLVEEVDGVDPQALQRGLGNLTDTFRATVEAAGSARAEIESELRSDDNIRLERLQRLAYELLIGEWAIDFGGVEEGNAALNRRTD